MRTAKGGSLKAMLEKAEAKRAAIAANDDPWGNPISYTHLSDEELEGAYEKSIASIPVDMSEHESMDIGELIRAYTELLG